MGKKNIVWNDYISQNERFADFFNGVVFAGKEVVLPDALTAVDTKLWRRKSEKDSYHEYIRDTAKCWEYKGKTYTLCLELEESPHNALPVKYMNYESLEYDRQYKEVMGRHREQKDLPHSEYLSGFAATDRLIPVVTVGVYLGERPWSGFTRLSDMAGAGEIPPDIREPMLRAGNDFQVNLFTVHTMKTSRIFQTDLREVFGFLKLLPDKNKLKHYVEENEKFEHLREDAYDVLSLYSGNRKLEYKKESYRLKEGNGMSMCTAMREWAEEERREGRQEGRHAGIAAVNELIRCLFAEGKTEELFRASQDLEYQKKLMEDYGILCEWEKNKGNKTDGERNEENDEE